MLKNCEEGTFVWIKIDLWLVQEEIENTGSISSKYENVMSTSLKECIDCLSPVNFAGQVDEIVGKMMAGDEESDSPTVGS